MRRRELATWSDATRRSKALVGSVLLYGTLERPQEVKDGLLVARGEHVEAVDDEVGLGRWVADATRAHACGRLVRLDRLQQVAGTAVMQEKQPLPDAPQRR